MNLDYTQNNSSKALGVFVGIQIVNMGALALDYLLLQSGKETITEFSVKNPVVGVAICAFELVSPISLGIHFYYF